jgi:uncharacterized protein YjgD (DUF1641 family)
MCRNAQKNFFNDNWFANCITILVKKKFSAPLKESFYAKVYAAVKKIPKGKVVTYGQIANILGSPRAARAVGYALNALKKGQSSGSSLAESHQRKRRNFF